jgi:hypothetical protein
VIKKFNRAKDSSTTVERPAELFPKGEKYLMYEAAVYLSLLFGPETLETVALILRV